MRTKHTLHTAASEIHRCVQLTNRLYLRQYCCVSRVHHFNLRTNQQRKFDSNQQYRFRNVSVHSFATSASSDNEPERRPLLNRFLRLFAVGPKVHYVLERSGAIVDHSLLNLISTSTSLAVYAFAAVSAMSYFGVDTTPFVGLFGVGGAALGFGMKDIANNYLCGVVLAMQSLFKRGDEVTVAKDYTGIVKRMNLRHLELEIMKEGVQKTVFVPHSDVFANAIMVHKKMPETAMDAMVTEQESESQAPSS